MFAVYKFDEFKTELTVKEKGFIDTRKSERKRVENIIMVKITHPSEDEENQTSTRSKYDERIF